MSPAKSELSWNVSEERNLLLDDPAEGGPDQQACHDCRQPGESAQGLGEAVSAGIGLYECSASIQECTAECRMTTENSMPPALESIK